jgi:hypothetical protein
MPSALTEGRDGLWDKGDVQGLSVQWQWPRPTRRTGCLILYYVLTDWCINVCTLMYLWLPPDATAGSKHVDVFKTYVNIVNLFCVLLANVIECKNGVNQNFMESQLPCLVKYCRCVSKWTGTNVPDLLSEEDHVTFHLLFSEASKK